MKNANTDHLFSGLFYAIQSENKFSRGRIRDATKYALANQWITLTRFKYKLVGTTYIQR